MMLQVVASIVALFVSLVLLVAGHGMLGTLLAIRLELEGVRAAVAGLILACFSVGFVLGSVFSIRIVKRVGHIRSFATFGALATAAILVHPVHVSVPGWMALRLVVGFCIAGLMLVTESWANARATQETRGTLLAIYMVLFYLAFASGQFLIALGDPALYQLFNLAAILVAVSLVPLSLTRSPAPELQEGDRLGVVALWRIAALGVAGAVLSGVVLSAFTTVGPIYAYRIGLDVAEVSRFMGVSILAAMVFQWPVGFLSDFLPRGQVVVAVAVAALTAGLLTALYGHRSPVWLFVTVGLFYGLAACIYPLCLALTHDALSQPQIVPASATLLLAYGLGTVAGPMLGGGSMTLLGPPGLFLFLAGTLAVLAVIGVQSLLIQKAPAVEEQTHCVGVSPVSTPVIMELDPRNEEFQEVEAPSEAGEPADGAADTAEEGQSAA